MVGGDVHCDFALATKTFCISEYASQSHPLQVIFIIGPPYRNRYACFQYECT